MSDKQLPLRLGFAGTPEFAVPALNALSRQHHVAAVFTQPDRPAGRGQPLHASPVKRRAIELGLVVHQPASFKAAEVLALLSSLDLDALVVVAYGQVLPANALGLPRFGGINIHASLLPRWRGAAPIQRALLAGDPRTGVSIMRMEAGLDTGPVYLCEGFEIEPDATASSLHDRLSSLGARLIIETLDLLAADAVSATPQPVQGVTYAEKIKKSEAQILWESDAGSILRQIRAFNPWPVAESRLNGEQVRIWEAAVAARDTTQAAANAAPGSVVGAGDAGIVVACGKGSLLIRRLQLAGRKALPAAEFLKGQRLTGLRFGSP